MSVLRTLRLTLGRILNPGSVVLSHRPKYGVSPSGEFFLYPPPEEGHSTPYWVLELSEGGDIKQAIDTLTTLFHDLIHITLIERRGQHLVVRNFFLCPAGQEHLDTLRSNMIVPASEEIIELITGHPSLPYLCDI